MTLQKFVLIDAAALDVAGVVAFVLGNVVVGVALFAAGLILLAVAALRRPAMSGKVTGSEMTT